MCIVCIEWKKGKLTKEDAYRNLTEMVMTGTIDGNHTSEAEDLIENASDEWETANQEGDI